MAQLNVSMPPALAEWVDTRIAEGRYADAEDYLRDLVRRDQERVDDDSGWLKAMIDEGLASGILDEDPGAIFDAILAEDPDFRA